MKVFNAKEMAEAMIFSLSENNEYQAKILIKKFRELEHKRKLAVSKHYKKLLKKAEHQAQKEYEQELITINLSNYFDDKYISEIYTHEEAFTVGIIIEAFTSSSAVKILQLAYFKDTIHHNRDLKIKEASQLPHDELKDRHTFNEYLNVVRDDLEESLIEGGTSKKRAKRIATKTISVIKKELRLKLKL